MIGHKNNRTKGTNNAPIPEDNEQYCFRMPLKLEVHKRHWTTQSNQSFGLEEGIFFHRSIQLLDGLSQDKVSQQMAFKYW